jgi:membrane protein
MDTSTAPATPAFVARLPRPLAVPAEIAYGATVAFFADKAPKKSASLSFYTLFSLAPLVTMVLMLVGLLADASVARSALADQLGGLIGRDSARAVLAVADASARDRHGGLASLLALATTVVGATTVFAELKDSLDEIWRSAAAPGKGWWELVRARLLSFGLLLAVGFLLLVSLLVSTVLASVGTQFGRMFADLAWIAEALNLVAALVVVTLLFAAMFKWLPNAKLAWRDVWSGAALTAVLFTIGKTLIGIYLGATAATSAFGAAGSLVVVVVWVYYSAWILFFGVEVTRQFAQRHGTLATPPAAQVPPRRR